MMRLLTLIVLALALGLAVGLYRVKYATEDAARQAARLENQIARERAHLRLLKAEWTNLASPRRLEILARRHLGLEVTASERIVPMEQISTRVGYRGPKLEDYNSGALEELIGRLPGEEGAPSYDADGLTDLLVRLRASADAGSGVPTPTGERDDAE